MNGELVATLESDLGEALGRLESLVEPGMGFGRIWLDGEEYPGITSVLGRSDHQVERLDVEVLPGLELARQTAQTLLPYLTKVLACLDTLASAFRVGDLTKLETLEALADALNYVAGAYQGISVFHGNEMVAERAAEVTLVHRLEEVVDALEKHDLIGAADILEYELRSVLESIMADVGAFLEAGRA